MIIPYYNGKVIDIKLSVLKRKKNWKKDLQREAALVEWKLLMPLPPPVLIYV